MSFEPSCFARVAPWWGALLSTVIGCGGQVTIDPAQSGEGGAGEAVTSATSTGASSTTSGGMPANLCAEACESLDACGGGFGNCAATCGQIAEGPCGEQHQVWLSCSLGETNTMCGVGSGIICEPQLRDYLSCSGIVAAELGCEEDPSGCACEVFVSPGIQLFQTCDAQGFCQCRWGDGDAIGFCPEPNSTCEPVANCCAGVFYTGGF